MEITTDIILRGDAWDKAFEDLKNIFATRTNYTMYMLALSIGIMYDKRIDKFEDQGIDSHSVPRNVLQNNDNGKLDIMFQAAILSTTTEDFSEEERLEYAFGNDNTFNKIGFLTQFANFGITKLIEQIGETEIETMENIKNYFCSTVEGMNFDIDELSDEYVFA